MQKQQESRQKGNVLFMVLLAVVLIGLLSAAIMGSGGTESSNIDKETLTIRASEVQRYASELERAILFIMQNGISESDIRFSHPDAHSEYGDLAADADPTDQVFHKQGGGAKYRAPPANVNDGSAWEFYGSTHLPGVGSNEADLVAVLPNVTQQFCDKINKLNDQNGTPTDDNLDAGLVKCIYSGAVSRFDDGQQFYTGVNINTVLEATFEQDPTTTITAARPALQACVTCSGTGALHFYHVIMAR